MAQMIELHGKTKRIRGRFGGERLDEGTRLGRLFRRELRANAARTREKAIAHESRLLPVSGANGLRESMADEVIGDALTDYQAPPVNGEVTVVSDEGVETRLVYQGGRLIAALARPRFRTRRRYQY